MIIQKVTHLKAFENIDSTNEWIVTDIDNAIPMDKRREEPTINMIIDDIRFSTIINVWFSGENLKDLKLKRRKVIYSYGIPTEIIETILIKDYSTIKNDPAIIPLNKSINAILNEKIKKKLKKLVPKFLTFTTCIGILAGGVALYTSDGLTEATSPEEISVSSDYVDTTEPITSVIPKLKDARDKVVKPPIDILKEYCAIYGFDEYTINQIYKENIDTILNAENVEETIMRCVYDFYTENLYRKIPTQYNINTEDEMETFIVNYAYVLGIDDEEILYTMLAIHELETGHGQSEICLTKNNLGGNIFSPPDSDESEFQFYPNAEVGAMDFAMDFYRIYKKTVPENLQRSNIDWSSMPITSSIEYYMNPVYCTEKMNEDDPEWYEIVANIKEILKENNRLDELKERVNEYSSTSRIK